VYNKIYKKDRFTIVMKKLYFLFAILLIFFAGCGGSKIGLAEEDITGDGLEVDISFDSSNINLGKVNYEITFENTGKDNVDLQSSNFVLTTVEEVNSQSIFTQDSISNFYNRIFPNTNLVLYQNQVVGPLTGVLFVDEEYRKDLAHEYFTAILNVKYPYRTEFKNNLEIDLMGQDQFKVIDSVSQAAPVKITDIELEQISLEEFNLILEVENTGGAGTSAEIENTDFKMNFRGNPIELNACETYVIVDKYKKKMEKLKFDSTISSITISCPVSFTDDDVANKFTTTISGEFSYDYKIKIAEEIKLR
jgi:hypothetical protein